MVVWFVAYCKATWQHASTEPVAIAAAEDSRPVAAPVPSKRSHRLGKGGKENTAAASEARRGRQAKKGGELAYRALEAGLALRSELAHYTSAHRSNAGISCITCCIRCTFPPTQCFDLISSLLCLVAKLFAYAGKCAQACLMCTCMLVVIS